MSARKNPKKTKKVAETKNSKGASKKDPKGEVRRSSLSLKRTKTPRSFKEFFFAYRKPERRILNHRNELFSAFFVIVVLVAGGGGVSGMVFDYLFHDGATEATLLGHSLVGLAVFLYYVSIYVPVQFASRDMYIMCALSFVFPVLIPWYLPPYLRLWKFIISASSVFYLFRVLELFKYKEDFKGWNVWWKMLFVICMSDVRQCVPVYDPKKDDSKPSEAKRKENKFQETLKEATKVFIHNILHCWWSLLQISVGIALVYFVGDLEYLSDGSNEGYRWWMKQLAGRILKWVGCAIFSYVGMDTLDYIYGFLYAMLGLKAVPNQSAPYGAYTLRQFWGGSWNRVTHEMLKEYFFFPIFNIGYPKIAILVSFIMSGVGLHIYPLWCADIAPENLLAVFMFFFLHGLYLLIEGLINPPHTPMVRKITHGFAYLTLPLAMTCLVDLLGAYP